MCGPRRDGRGIVRFVPAWPGGNDRFWPAAASPASAPGPARAAPAARRSMGNGSNFPARGLKPILSGRGRRLCEGSSLAGASGGRFASHDGMVISSVACFSLRPGWPPGLGPGASIPAPGKVACRVGGHYVRSHCRLKPLPLSANAASDRSRVFGRNLAAAS